MNTNKIHPRVIIGLVLILLGTYFVLDNYFYFDFDLPHYIFDWRNILIGIGAIILVSASHKSTGLVFIAIGMWGHFPELWPLALIGLGIIIILRRNESRHKFGKFTSDESFFQNKMDDISIFGGGKKKYQSDNFQGGKITSIFGGSEIDFSQCQLADGENYLDILAIFGGSTLIMPSDWKVIIDLVPLFGGFSDNRRKDPSMIPRDDKVLYIKGMVLFGGGEIVSF